MKRLKRFLPAIIATLVILSWIFAYINLGVDSGDSESMAHAVSVIDFSRLQDARDAIANFPASGRVAWRQPRFDRSTITFTGLVDDMEAILKWRSNYWPEIAAEFHNDMKIYGNRLGGTKMGFTGLLPGVQYTLNIEVSREFTLIVNALKKKQKGPANGNEMLTVLFGAS